MVRVRVAERVELRPVSNEHQCIRVNSSAQVVILRLGILRSSSPRKVFEVVLLRSAGDRRACGRSTESDSKILRDSVFGFER